MFGGADFVSSGTFEYYSDVWALGADNQWVQLIPSEQTTPTPPQESSGIPWFEELEVSIGILLGAVILVVYRRRLATRIFEP